MSRSEKKIDYKIRVKPSCFVPDFVMIVSVPVTSDPEEYIDDLLESFVDMDIFCNLEWDFE